MDSLTSQEIEEIIISDGGSHDRTVEIGQRAGKVVQGPRGRGGQLNRGARAAKEDLLLFLHADCRLESGAIERARRILEYPGAKAGCFTQQVDDPSFLFRGVEWGASFRARRLGILYGDSGLFLRRELFLRLGGFPEVPLFEDVGISRRLRRHEGQIVVCPARIHISPRRWRQLGFFRTTFLNWSLSLSYFLGESPEKLYRRYQLR